MDRLEEEAKLSLAKNDLMPIMRVVRAFTKLESILQTGEVVTATLRTKEKRTEQLTTEIALLEERVTSLEARHGVLESREAQELETAIKTLRFDLGEVTTKFNEKVHEEQQLTEKLVTLRAEVTRITTRLSNVI